MFGGISNLLFNKAVVKIKLDDTNGDRPDHNARSVHSFDAEGAITGYVQVTVPDKGRLYHYGVKVSQVSI